MATAANRRYSFDSDHAHFRFFYYKKIYSMSRVVHLLHQSPGGSNFSLFGRFLGHHKAKCSMLWSQVSAFDLALRKETTARELTYPGRYMDIV